MHIYSNCENSSNESSTKMSNVGIDNRLRRQVPVTAKPPPRLRLGLRALAPHSQQRQQQHVHDTNTWPSVGRHASLESLLAAGGGGTSSQENRRSPIQSAVHHQKVVNNGKGPLIHHQRHNLKNRFYLLKTLGEGAYGKVKLAADKSTGEHVAIKYIKKTKIENENDLNRIRREIQILSSLRHKHIVNIREVFERKDKIVLVLDYAQGGELYDYLNRMGKLSELEARRIFRQIVSAIYYCHQNGIVHRDLKLENIILDDQGNVKIADFGLSNYYSLNSTLKTFCGSPLYASPEIVNGKPYHGPEVDVWSLGVILYTLVYGSMPFESNDLVSLKRQISDGDYNQPSKLSDAAGLIRHMLTVTPSRRATMEDALRHWWINFGHTQMPNDITYSPEDEPPTLQYSIATEQGPLVSPLDPPAVIHHRNQSSISSDSDLELDFRPNRWTKRTISLDSTGNSVSSSVTGSPAPTPDSCRHFARDNQDDAAIGPGLLSLPVDVLEILKGCSSKSLAALLNKENTSSGFHLETNVHHNKAMYQAKAEDNKEDEAPSEKIPSVFDSERKPKRGILKRKGKFSGSDGQCGVAEEKAVGAVDNSIPKCGHLPRRLPSFKDEAHGIFVSKHRASQLLDPVSDNDSYTSAISHSAWSSLSSQLLKEQHDLHQPLTPESISFVQDPDTHSCSVLDSIVSTDVIPSYSLETTPPEQETMPAKSLQECDHKSSAKLLSRESTADNICNKEPTRVVYRPKGILKKSSFDDGKNRLSISSIGSNSSADILDLSYDSGDSDHFVNVGSEHAPESDVSVGEGAELTHKSGHLACDSFDEQLVVLQISENPHQQFQGQHCSQSNEEGQL